ncbi:hypothetical protein F4808DRAFT_455477 [Astrocystis sublimbata]|nr:hypothetical protein F4808DRAFT_455477 [Astrocystis sublimbata]
MASNPSSNGLASSSMAEPASIAAAVSRKRRCKASIPDTNQGPSSQHGVDETARSKHQSGPSSAIAAQEVSSPTVSLETIRADLSSQMETISAEQLKRWESYSEEHDKMSMKILEALNQAKHENEQVRKDIHEMSPVLKNFETVTTQERSNHQRIKLQLSAYMQENQNLSRERMQLQQKLDAAQRDLVTVRGACKNLAAQLTAADRRCESTMTIMAMQYHIDELKSETLRQRTQLTAANGLVVMLQSELEAAKNDNANR